MNLGVERTLGDDVGVKLRAIFLSILMLTSVLSVGGVGGVAAQTDICEVTVEADESIQDAIDAAQTGDTICVSDGMYEEGLTISTNGLTLVAADGAQPVLEGSNGIHGIHVDDATGVTIDGFVIQNFGSVGIYLEDAPSAMVRHTEVRNNDGGIMVNRGNETTIESNVIENNDAGSIPFEVHGGIHMANSIGSVLENNEATGNYKTNIYVRVSDEATIRGNTLGNAFSGQEGSLRVDESENVLVENNTVTGNIGDELQHGIRVVASTGATVVDNHIEGNDGAGLRIPNSNDLTATGNTITNNWMGIDVGGAGDSTNLVLEANTVENSTTAGIRIRKDGVVVRNNQLSNNQGSGVNVNEAREVVVRDNVIDNSGVSGVSVFGTSLSAREGIVEGNTISGSGQNGIRIDGPRDMTVRSNNVTSSGEHGITAVDTESIVIDDSEFSGSQLSGIHTDGAVNVTVTNNTVNANTESGILIRDTVSDDENREMRIGGNVVTDNVDGVRLEGGNLDRVTIESNRLESNTDGVTIADNPTAEDALRINQNAIQNNANRGVNHLNAQRIDITNNWWGDASGPSGGAVDYDTGTVANGTGDSIEHDQWDNRFWFDPWLTTDPAAGSDPAAGQFDVAITATNEPVTAGESLVVTATITNTGDEETTETVELRDGATVLDTVDVTLNAGASNSTAFTWETTEADTGVFDLSVVSPSDSDTVTVTINAPSAGAFFAVTIDDTNEPIAAGETLEVSATIANTGDTEDTQTIELVAFDGTTVVDSTSLTLAAEATETLVLNWSSAPEGTGDVTVRSDDDDATRTVAIGTETAVEVASCRVIDTAGNYALSTDLTGGETCIQITASDVTFDGMGHTIEGSDLSDEIDVGVLVYNPDERIENVTVTNVVLTGWDNGVRFRTVDTSDLSNVVVENSSTGIILSASHDNELTDLTVRNNDGRGLSLSSSNDNVVSGVEATGNEADTTFGGRGSVNLFGSSNNVFEDVSVTDGRSGIRVSFSSGNEFVGVTTERHANYGLEVESNSNTFTDVIANDNGWHGIQVNTASFNSFENISVTGTDGSAVRLTGIGSGSPPQNNVFENVSVTDNDGEAISLSVANYNTFRDVTTASNTGTAVNFVSRAESNLVEFGEINHGSNTAINFGSDSVGNTIREVSLSGTGTPFVAQDGTPNNEFDRVDIDGTVVSVSARGVGSFRTSPSTLPADATPLDSYLGLTPHSLGTTHVEHLRFHYEAADVESLDENALAIWRLTGGEWVAPTDATYVTGVDTDQQYVFASGIDESHLSATFGAFATEGSTDPGDDDDSGSGGGGGSGGSGGSGSSGGSGGGTATPGEPEPEPDAPFFAVNIIETTSPVTAGDTLDVTAVIENVGGEDGTGPVDLVVDGTVVDTASLSLSSGDEAAVTLSWATTADDVAETISIEVRSDDDVATAVVTVEPVDEAADIVLYNARAQSDTVDVGDTLTVVGDFYNLGTTGGERTVTLFVDGEAVDDATVTVSPGLARNAAQLTWTPTESDVPEGDASTDVTVSLDGLLVGTVTVENPYSDIRVIAAATTDSILIEGEETYTIGSVYQSGTIEGTETFDLIATNRDTNESVVVGSQDVTVAPGTYNLGAINITFQPDTPGTYDLTLGDRAAGWVEVDEAVSDIVVIAAATADPTLIEGEETYVIGSVYQRGNIEGTQTKELVATNRDTNESVVVGSQEITVAPGTYNLGGLNVSFELESAGTYDLTLGDRAASWVEVDEAVSDIVVIAAATADSELIEGEETYTIGSVYQSGNVEGTQTIELVATNRDTNESVVVGSQEITVAPGTYNLGGLNVSFEPESAGTYDLTLGDQAAGWVEVEEAFSDIRVIAAASVETEVVEGEEAYVIGSVYQAGNVVGTETIDLVATDVDTGVSRVVDSQDVTVASGTYNLGALNVTFQPAASGTYDLTLGGRSAGTVEALPSESDLVVIAATMSEVELIEGEKAYAIGSVYQAGTAAHSQEIQLTATNQDTGETTVVGSQEVTVAPSTYNLGALNITFQPDAPGTYDLTLGDRDAGTVGVQEAIIGIQVIGSSVSAVELIEGEEAYVIGSVYGGGNVEGTETIELVATNRDTNESVVVDSQEITVAPGTYNLGAINITFQPDSAGTYDLTLGDRSAGWVEVAEAASDIVVIAAATADSELIEGEETYTIGSVYQRGNIEGTQTIELVATNRDTNESVVVDSQEITVAPGTYNLGGLNVSFEPESAGTYDLTLGDRAAGWVEVEEAVSDIVVIAAATIDDELIEGEETHVIGSVYQRGNIEGTQTKELVATNRDTNESVVVGSQEITVAPGTYNLGGLNVSFEPESAGTYDLTLGDRAAGWVEVDEAVSDIRVIAATAVDNEMVVSEETYVIGSVYQSGNVEGTETKNLVATNRDTGVSRVVGSQDVTVAPGTYHLGALNVTFRPESAGTYDLTLGDQAAGWVDVVPPTFDLSIAAVHGQGTGYDSSTGELLVYASDDASVDVDVESDVPVDEVTLLVSSQATTFAVTATGTHVADDRWSIDVPLDDIPDDGRYDLTVVATADVADAGDIAVAEEVLVIDRSLPSVSVSIGNGLLDSATVTVTSDVPLADAPAVEADFIDADGTIQSVPVTMDGPGPDETRYTGTIHAEDSGTYAVTVVATDRAGNEATAEASAHITRLFTLADGPITFDRHGSAVEFHLAEDANQAIAEQELFGSFTAYDGHHDTGGALGVGFLTADLDSFIDHQLETGGVESATVSIAVDETTLGDASVDEVMIQHYEPTTGSWTPVETTHGTVAGAPMVSAEVTHFSTYGAFLVDETPPTVLEVTPDDGATVTAEDDIATVAFTYEDDRSGVDVSSVRIAIDGTDVTAADGTMITSERAEHAFTAVAGETYEATLTVADRVGNEQTQTVTFDVVAHHDRIVPTNGVGLVILLFVAVVLAAGAVAYRRRDR